MTRGHTPPPSLTAEDILSLAQVRKDIWVNAAKGFLVGGSSAYLFHRGLVFANTKKIITLNNLNRNTAFASFMVGSALGSFLMATSAGKNSVHTLHPIFQRGANSNKPLAELVSGDNDNYQHALQRAKERNDDLRELERSRLLRNSFNQSDIGAADNTTTTTTTTTGEADRLELERNRIIRRASLTRSMTRGHGLSDSHGGHWVKDEFRKE